MSEKTEEVETLKPTFMSTKSDKKKPKREITKTSQTGTKENETRATFIIKEELLEKLKSIAYWERAMIKDVINTALVDAVAKYERKNGEIKVITKN